MNIRVSTQHPTGPTLCLMATNRDDCLELAKLDKAMRDGGQPLRLECSTSTFQGTVNLLLVTQEPKRKRKKS